jgi:DNA-binding LacI/PurR family transcriptional regulator
VRGPQVDFVTADHWSGAFDATTHLVKLGHRRIGFIGVSADHAGKLRRFQGYADALKRHHIPLRSEWVAGPEASPAYSTEQDGYEAMMKVAKLKSSPTAILCRNDYTAIGAMHALQQCGLRVPEDVAVASFDNTPLAAFTAPPLTSVAQPIAEQGRRAAEFLLDRIEGRVKNGHRELTLKCHLVVRESTGRRVPQRGEA